MAWKSVTFSRSQVAGSTAVRDAASTAINRHREAMTEVIVEARRLADERARTLDQIQDPDLKRSAAR